MLSVMKCSDAIITLTNARGYSCDMSFNEGVQSNSGRVRTSRGGRGVAIGGGSVAVLIGLFLLSRLTGIDLTGLAGGAQPSVEEQSGSSLQHCQTGADANQYVECRMVTTADSLDVVWQTQLPEQAGMDYQPPSFQLFEQAVNTACGTASSQVGPFYCPSDASVHLDLGFFQQMESQLGAANAPLAQEYVVAHEWGHHIQHLRGIFAEHRSQETGEQSDAVRLELQADCYAGVWMHWASQTKDPESGEAFLKEPTSEELAQAWQTAEAIGDDRIQEQAQGTTNPESWTHGSAEQRQRWLETGVQNGSLEKCDTFAAPEV